MNLLASIKSFFRDTAFAGPTRSASALAQAFLRGQDVDSTSDSRAKLSSPYSQSSWVYTAVSGLAEGISQIPFRFSRKDQIPIGAPGRIYRGLSSNWCRRARQAAVDSGPVVALFNRPHEYIDRDLFWQYLVVWEALRGEFFIVPLDASDGAVRLDQRAPKIAKMLVLSPDFFWHRVVVFKLEAWRYTGSPLMSPLASQYFLPEELVHKMRPNPYLFWRGLSPLTAALLPAQSDYAASQFMKGLMLNNADTGLIATSDQWLSSEQRVVEPGHRLCPGQVRPRDEPAQAPIAERIPGDQDEMRPALALADPAPILLDRLAMAGQPGAIRSGPVRLTLAGSDVGWSRSVG